MNTAANAYQAYTGPHPEAQVHGAIKARAEGGTMKALAWFAPKDVRVIDAPIPDLIEDEDVVIKVTGTTICGSDLHLYHGEIMAMQKGDILGHEFMGVIDRIGKNVTKRHVGERVVVSFQVACGSCKYCKQKLSSFCDKTNDSTLQETMYGQRDAGFFGYSHFTGGYPGGQAEYVRVPFGDVNCLPIPDSVVDEQALFLSDILPTSLHCVVDTGVQPGDTVGIWGLGPIGLCAAQWCKLKGAKRVIGIDCVPSRLKMANERLGVECIDFSKDKDVVKKLRELVPAGLDCALDCGTFHEPKSLIHKAQKLMMLETDNPETINECLMTVKKMGRIGIIAAYAGYANGVNVGALMERGIRLIGNGQAPVHLYWEEILNDYLITGKFDMTLIVTHRVPIEDMAELYHAFDKRPPGVEKVFVETQFSKAPSPGYPKLTRVSEWPLTH